MLPLTSSRTQAIVLFSLHSIMKIRQQLQQPVREDQLLLLVSQQYENANAMAAQSPYTSTSARFGAPVILESINQLITSKVEEKIRKTTHWANNVWREWAVFRKSTVMQDERAYELNEDFSMISQDELLVVVLYAK